MTISLEDDDFVKSRRNLVVISCTIFIFYFLHEKIKKISILGTEIESSAGHADVWVLLAVFSVYFYFRFLQIFEFSLITESKDILDAKAAISSWLTMRVKKKNIIDAISMGIAEGNQGKAADKISFNYDVNHLYQRSIEEGSNYTENLKRRIRSEHIKDLKFEVVANVTYKIGNTMSSTKRGYSFEPSRSVMMSSAVLAFMYVSLFKRWATDNVFPLILGLLAIYTAFMNI